MNTTRHAIRTGLHRGVIEWHAGLTNPQDLWSYFVMSGMFLIPLYFLRHTEVPGVDVPLATLAVPGVIGMVIVYGGAVGTGYTLAMEREDGTLLRLKAIPHGIVGYLTGVVLLGVLQGLLTLALLLVPAMLLFEGVAPGRPAGWLALLGLFLLGVVAVVPLGLVIGSIASNPRTVGGTGFLVLGGLVAISGVFYPITELAGWLQAIAQVFPVYWLGLGMRSVFLPPEAVAVEIGGSWRTVEMLGVVGAWAVLSLALAPVALRRMARRESGAAMEQRRQAVLQWRA